MVSLKQLFEWFTTGKFPTEAQFAEQFKSFWHKSEKIAMSYILGLVDALNSKASKEDLDNAIVKFKGYHSTLAELQTAYPQSQNRKDFFAWVGSPYPGTVWKVFADGGAWINTGEVPTQQEIDLAEYAKKTEVDKKAEKTAIYNVSQQNNNKNYESRSLARADIPVSNRGLGQIISYYTIASNKSTDFVKTAGQSVHSSTGLVSQTVGDRENMCVTVDIPDGYTEINIRIVVTGGDNGGAFYDENGSYISGYKFTSDQGASGERKNVSIPLNAKVLKTTYKNDQNVGSIPVWDYVAFINSNTVEDEIVVEQFIGTDLTNWGNDLYWEDVKKKPADLNNYLIASRGKNIYKSITDEVKGRLQLNRVIYANTGAIKEDLTRDISIIYMQPVPAGSTLQLYAEFPVEFQTNDQPVIHVYKNENNINTRIDVVKYNDTNNYIIQNSYGNDVFLTFYTQVTQSGSYPNFNIIGTIEAYSVTVAENTIKRANGTVILNKIDKIVYADSHPRFKNVSNILLDSIKTNLAIEVDGKVVATTNAHKIVQMAQLKANTEYVISGFQNTWGASFPYVFLYDNSATDAVPGIAASKIMTFDNIASDGSISFITDSKNTKLSMYIAYAGTTFPVFDSENTINLLEIGKSDYKLVDENGNTIQVVGANAGSDLSKEVEIRVPFPTSIAKLNIKIDALPAFKGDKKNCVVEVDWMNGNSFTKNAEIDIQGATTANNPNYLQKNYTIGFLNDDGSECNIKIGDFPFDVKCQIKSFWTDSSHARDPVLSSIINDYDMIKPYGSQLPYSKYYKGYETGAKCISLGIPFETYVNDSWHGLYHWILRFKRGNWNVEKNNPDQILMKSGSSDKPMTAESIQVNDEYWEFENPKLNDETRAKVMRLFDFLRTQNAAAYKAELHNYMDIDSVLEYFIWIDAFQLIDNFWGNLVLVTYDGVIWHARVRDLDRSLGISFNDQSFLNPVTPLNQEEKYAKSIWFPKIWTAFQDELKIKYADMYQKVLNPEYLAKKFQQHENIIGAELFDKSLKKWSTRPGNIAGYETNANQIIEYYKKRLTYLNAKYGYVE